VSHQIVNGGLQLIKRVEQAYDFGKFAVLFERSRFIRFHGVSPEAQYS
jgi:hypothetical protein